MSGGGKGGEGREGGRPHLIVVIDDVLELRRLVLVERVQSQEDERLSPQTATEQEKNMSGQ